MHEQNRNTLFGDTTPKGVFFMTGRGKVRCISFAAAFALCMLGVLLSSFAGANRFEARINADTGRALSTAVRAVNELDLSLQKCACATTPAMQNRICTEVYANAQQAELALSILPVKSTALEEIARHIAVVGDYSYTLSRRNADGMCFSEQDMKNLSAFSGTTAVLNESLAELLRLTNDGEICSEHFDRITDSLNNLEEQASAAADTMEYRMDEAAASFPDVPKLKYDGAYTDRSDHLAKVLEGRMDVSEDEAKTIAADWIGCDPKELKSCGLTEGNIVCYCFEGRANHPAYRVAVTKAGGMVIRLNREAAAGDRAIDEKEAVDKAKAFLSARGYQDLEPVRSEISGGEARLRFVYVQDHDLICYPDSVDVMVSLSNGEVTAFDAQNYLMHHVRRDTAAFQDAADSLSPAVPSFLEIVSVRKAILDGFGDTERYCCQVDCVDRQKQRYQLYINAQTGEQEEIRMPDELEFVL